MVLRVGLVGDDALALEALRARMESPELVVSGQAAPQSEGVELADPDAVALDLGPDPEAALDWLRGAGEAWPTLALVWSAGQAGAALAAGARGAVGRGAPPGRLVAALVAVARGLHVVDEQAAGESLRPRVAGGTEPIEPLTPREGEVLQLLVEGYSNRRIAERLGISEHTAKFHVNSILGKLGASSRAEALTLAVRQGLVVL
jgi:DNA-binding NarL/FixJ family response regulator